MLQINTLRSCRGENNFNPLVILAAQNYLGRAKLFLLCKNIGSCKIIWLVQNHLGGAKLFGPCKIIWVVQNYMGCAKLFWSCKVLNSAAHLTTTTLYVQCRPRQRCKSQVKCLLLKLSKAILVIPCCLLLLIVTLLSQRIPCSPFPRDANHQECFDQMTLHLDSYFLNVFARIPWWAVQCTLPTMAALPSTNRLHSSLELCTTYKDKVWFDAR